MYAPSIDSKNQYTAANFLCGFVHFNRTCPINFILLTFVLLKTENWRMSMCLSVSLSLIVNGFTVEWQQFSPPYPIAVFNIISVFKGTGKV